MSIQVISFNCILKNKLGAVLSSTYNREVLNAVQGKEQELVGLVKGLQNLSKGEHRTITLPAEEAYGLYDPAKIILYPRSKLPKHLTTGELVVIVGKSGRARSYRVLEFHDSMVSLDGNHPLAGQDLIFEIEALDVREATDEEISESVNTMVSQVLH
jgi:FKBP-type peptidyl-prolyl cis-trans isomerase SlyD